MKPEDLTKGAAMVNARVQEQIEASIKIIKGAVTSVVELVSGSFPRLSRHEFALSDE